MIRVPDSGTGRERLVIIGEAPGAHEVAQGAPFVGPSGHVLRQWMAAAGLKRSDAYWTNVYSFQPPGNNIAKIDPETIAAYVHQLHARLAKLEDPWLIVPTGNVALKALTGKVGITKHRGSIYEYHFAHGPTTADSAINAHRRVKVIPTIHPAATFRQPGWARRCQADWRRIAGDLAFRELRLPERELITNPTYDDLAALQPWVDDPNAILGIDIETPRELTFETTSKVVKKSGLPKLKKVWGRPYIKCIAFAPTPTLSVSVPLTLNYWGSQHVLDAVWKVVKSACESPCQKVLQNGLFDSYYLAEMGIHLNHFIWDTRWMHATLDPLDDHDLAYMASIDTRQPYWKDEAKDPDEIAKYASNFEALRSYNATDGAVTRELADVYRTRLADRGRLDFYHRHYGHLLTPLHRLMRGGVRHDPVAAAEERRRLSDLCRVYQQALTDIAGEPLYGKKDLSPKKLAKFLYETLRLPTQISRATGKVTTAEVTVRRLMLKYPQVLGKDDEHDKPGRLILDHRRASKLAAFVKEGVADADGYIRSQYGFTTTGRLTSSRNPARTGQNLQNVDRELRHLYTPDRGQFFLEVDLSQAESRVVYAQTGDPALIAIAQTRPDEFDDHNRTAGLVFGCPVDKRGWPNGLVKYEVTPEQRYFGKHVRHAHHYDMQGPRMSDELLKEGTVKDPEECQMWLTRLNVHEPAIALWKQAVRIKVMQDRQLRNSWGRVVDFTYERLGDDTFRVAYAWGPQSEIGDLTNQWGVVPLDDYLNGHNAQLYEQFPAMGAGPRSRLCLQTHDSLTISTTLDEAYDIAVFLKASLERPRRYGHVDLSIPLEYAIGTSWQMTTKFKRLPDREEFGAAVEAMLR